MKKVITSKSTKNVDILVAIDISGNKLSLDSIKSTLSLFDSMTNDYNCNAHVVLIGDDITLDFDIDDISKLDNFILPEQHQCNYKKVFEYAEEKIQNDEWDIFRLYFITDGYGIFPEESNIHTTWITTKNTGVFPFGEVLEIKL